jgi:hypothetical protein
MSLGKWYFWYFKNCYIIQFDMLIEQRILDTNAGKQQSYAATDIKLTLVLKKITTFKYRLEI